MIIHADSYEKQSYEIIYQFISFFTQSKGFIP